ncbi:MAG: cytochrome c553 [Verrucomicrobiales bacterium]
MNRWTFTVPNNVKSIPRSLIWVPAAAGLLVIIAVWHSGADDSKSDAPKAPEIAVEKSDSIPATISMAKQGIEGVFGSVCAACHGVEGEGNPELKAPSIAGMPAWYVEIQLEKFRSGIRGAHPEDLEGTQMRAMSIVLKPEWIQPMAKHVAALKPRSTENTLGGDGDEVAWLYEQQCMACHRYNGQGERVFRSAPLTTLPDWYLAAALRKYRDGIRGPDEKEDPDAWKMHQQARLLSDELIVDLAAYIAELAQTYPPGVRRGRVRR